RFFAGARIDPTEQTLHAVIFLRESASLWWEGNSLPDSAPFEEFEEAFRAEFRPAGFMDYIRGLVLETKFTTTLSEYISIIRRLRGMLMSSISGDDGKQVMDDTIKASFLKGVPKELNQMLLSYEVANPHTCDLHNILTAAERFDQIYHFKPDQSQQLPANNTPRHHALATAPNFVQPDPMAMEIDHIALAINALTQLANLRNNGNNRPRNNFQSNNHQQQYNNRPNNNRPLAPLTQQERNYLRANGGCFKCRQLGHFANSGRLPETADLDPLASLATLAPTLTKSKLRRMRKRAVRLQSFTQAQAERTLLTFIGSVNGRPARILIDGGAE
ncbi:hypothetical protein BGX28_001373, partial [Mortierella sp. GBA30]